MKYFLVDGNGLIWRAIHKSRLENDGVAFGLLSRLQDALSLEPYSVPIIFWDEGVPRWRTALYPAYKSGRKDQKAALDMNAIMEQVGRAKAYLATLPLLQVTVPGVEADDLLSWFSEYIVKDLRNPVTVFTADRDLWQLCGRGVLVYDAMRRTYITEGMIHRYFGVPAHQIAEYKTLVGDTSDSIPGVKGIGDKTAEKLFSEFLSLWRMMDPDNKKWITKSRTTAKLYASEDDLERDYQITLLPWLKDAPYLLNKEEKINLVKCLGEQQPGDPMLLRTLNSRFGGMLEVPSWTMARPDLSGIQAYITQPDAKKYDWSNLDQSINTCQGCDLRAGCGDYGPTLPDGYNDAEIMIVGRNPDADEMVNGKPFVGKCGKVVDDLIKSLYLTRRDCWLTNACKCYSEDDRPPTIGEVHACVGYLASEIELIKPKFIISFGTEAMSMLTPYSSGVSAHSGEIVPLVSDYTTYGCDVAISVHPSAALRSGKGLANFEYATQQIREYMDERGIAF